MVKLSEIDVEVLVTDFLKKEFALSPEVIKETFGTSAHKRFNLFLQALYNRGWDNGAAALARKF